MAKKPSKKSELVEQVLSAALPVRERPKNLQIVSGSGYHDFKTSPVFEGNYKGVVKAKEDNPKFKTKKGDVIGYTFVEKGSKSEQIISSSHHITKALEDDKFSPKRLWWIEFLGQKKISGGRKVNDFLIGKQN